MGTSRDGWSGAPRRGARLAVLAAGSLVATAVLALLGPAASAHTELVSSAPAPQSQQPDPPSTVELRFSTAVDAPAGAIRVFDPAARRVDAGAVSRIGGDPHTVTVPLAGDLGLGTYTAAWRVIADDGHPLEGAFTFRVGAAGRQTAATNRSIGAPTAGGGLVGGLLAACRWLVYAGLIVLVGGSAFVQRLWPAGWADRRAVRLLWTGWSAALLGTVGGLLLHGPNATGRGVGAAFDSRLLGEVLGSRYGTAGVARLGLLGLAAALLARHARWRRPALAGRLAAPVGLALLVTPTVTGHAATADLAAVAMTLEVVHLVALALWLGGLAVLAAAMLRAPVVDRDVVARFSRLAFACVVAVAVTGTAQGWREVRTVGALTNTRYGTLLVVKVALFVALLAAAAFSRRWVQGRVARRTTTTLLRRSVGAEVVVATVVLVVASLLVAAPPARTAYARPFRVDLPLAPLRLAIEVSPARTGPVTLDVRTTDSRGADAPVTFVTVDLRLPAYNIGPLRVRMQRISASHYRAVGIDLPLPGRWQLETEVFLGGGKTRSTTTFTVT